VYALRAVGVDDDSPPDDRIEHMAQRYVQDIRATSHGPYQLGGWSLGGIVAFEVARQLTALGERVEHLALIDAFAPVHVTRNHDQAAILAVHAWDIGVDVGKRQLEQLRPDEQIALIARETARAGILSAATAERYIRRLLRVFSAQERALGTYEPGRFDGQVTLFSASEQEDAAAAAAAARDSTYGWSGHLERPLVVRHLPGNHQSIAKEPLVAQLAEAMKATLWVDGDPTREREREPNPPSKG
jgi:thioesterase domain-containing protein